MKLSPIIRGVACVVLLSTTIMARAGGSEIIVAAAPQSAGARSEAKEEKLSPEEKMLQRFPQPIRVGNLIGLRVLDEGDSTIGYVRQVVRTSGGKIQLIVPYRAWFGWSQITDWGMRPVAVPLEAVAMLGRQVAALDMSRKEFDGAPAFALADVTPLAPDDTIRIAVTRR